MLSLRIEANALLLLLGQDSPLPHPPSSSFWFDFVGLDALAAGELKLNSEVCFLPLFEPGYVVGALALLLRKSKLCF